LVHEFNVNNYRYINITNNTKNHYKRQSESSIKSHLNETVLFLQIVASFEPLFWFFRLHFQI